MTRCLNFSFLTKVDDEPAIDILPNELLIEIFRRLPVEELIRCAGVCSRWRTLTRHSNLWMRMPIICSAQLGDIGEKKLQLIELHKEHIRVMKFQYILSYDFIRNAIRLCDNLVSIELIMCRVEKEFEDEIQKWHDLKKFNMKNSLLKSETDLDIKFDQFTKLNYLGLSDFGLSAKNCERLLKCHHLNYIHIDKIRGLTLEFMKQLVSTKADTLVSLRIYGQDAVNDEIVFMLAKCPMLEELAIIRCENLSNKSLAAVATCKGLKILQLWNNNTFTESMLLSTLSNPYIIKLKSLSLSRIQNVTTKIVNIISEYYRDVRFLALYQCPRISDTDYEKQLKLKFTNIEIVL